MTKSWQILLQCLAYVAFAVVVGYFSSAPAYVHLDPNKALIKLSLSHAGQLKGECRRLTQEELEKLAPNMRRPLDCPRERLPLLVELILDGNLLYRELLPPTGLASDGASVAYARFTVEPGSYQLIARLRDSNREQGFDYEHGAHIELRPQQNFVVDFRAEPEGFIFK
jgi:hypothetical protein